MPTQQKRRNTLYGYPNPQAGLQQEPIVAQRAPTTADGAELGTIWVDQNAQDFTVLCDNTGGVNVWTGTSGGATTVTSMTVNPGNLTVTAGDVIISAGDLTMAPGSTASLGSLSAGATTIGSTLGVTGNTTIGGTLGVTGTATFAGDVTVDGTLTANGDFDLTSPDAILITSTSNTNPAIELTVNGGTTETLILRSLQGTSSTSIDLVSTSGGVTLGGGLGTANAINLVAGNAAGGITMASGTNGILIGSNNGPISILTGTGAIGVGIDATAKVVTVGNHTGATAVDINAGSGGVGIAALNGAVQITSGTGQMDLGSDAAATVVNLATGAAVKTVTVGSITSTSATTVRGGSGGVALVGTNGPISISSGTGVMNISADAAATTLNVGTGAAIKTVAVGSTTAGSSLALNSPTGSNVVAANGLSVTTAGRGVSLPGGLLVLAGAGSPDTAVTAPAGSLYLRSDPAGATSRAYINTDGVTAWTNITCAA